MSYFADPQANYSRGLHDGHDIGVAKGFNNGVSEGHQSGYERGWEEAIAAGNVQILKALEFNRQHVAEQQRLTQQIDELSHVLRQQAAYVDALEAEKVQRAAESATLCSLLAALKESNQHLSAEVETLDQKFQARTKEYNDQLWQYNRSVVFMNSVRAVLVNLTAGGDAEANRVRAMFAQCYSEQVADAIKTGALKTRLESDPEFARTLPRSQQFLLEMLRATAG